MLFISVCSKPFRKCYILLDLRYLINDVKATWTYVDTQVCSHHNWSLISLQSELEQDFVSNLLQDRFDIDGIIYVYIGKRYF